MTLAEIIESAAFVSGHHEAPGIIASVSGPYITLWGETRPGHYAALDGCNPLHHSEQGDNGLYGHDAAVLRDECLEALGVLEGAL